MTCCLLLTHRRWLVGPPPFVWLLIGLAMVLSIVTPTGAVLAADEHGFAVLPDTPRVSGPIGRSADTFEILATRERTKGAFGIFRIEVAPQSGPPAHIHRGEDEFFYVLKGQFQFKLGEQLVDAPAGSFIFLPRDHIHTFQNIGAENGLLLVGVTPAGFEHLFVERQGVDMETQQALFKKYGIEIVGPPLGSASTPASRR